MKELTFRDLVYQNRITGEVLRISIEGDDHPVILMYHWIVETVNRTVDWEQLYSEEQWRSRRDSGS